MRQESYPDAVLRFPDLATAVQKDRRRTAIWLAGAGAFLAGLGVYAVLPPNSNGFASSWLLLFAAVLWLLAAILVFLAYRLWNFSHYLSSITWGPTSLMFRYLDGSSREFEGAAPRLEIAANLFPEGKPKSSARPPFNETWEVWAGEEGIGLIPESAKDALVRAAQERGLHLQSTQGPWHAFRQASVTRVEPATLS